ncbi:MAG: ATP-dependent DNA helicase [Propionibacteriaceae bacterium]|jgi:ATP-dependent DNA helicase DinG|nr:ATP-dependent DNA helicase [Propionibacteriaceae bacterium]
MTPAHSPDSPDSPDSANSSYLQVLDAFVTAIGGQPRTGQQEMAAAVAETFNNGGQLLVQAGTGTGKSLGYLAPAFVWAHETQQRVVVATATLALQTQLAGKDIPAALDAVEKVLGVRLKAAVVKGRSNYACLYKVRAWENGEQDALLSAVDLAEVIRTAGGDAASVLGAEVLALREWAEKQAEMNALGERDAAPKHSLKAWNQVSVPSRECVGVTKCPFGEECFTERSRAIARKADVVVTNHTMLAIDAIQDSKTLPEYAAIVVDEAHDLVDRVTGAADAELSPQQVERAIRQITAFTTNNELIDNLTQVASLFNRALDITNPGRVTPDAQHIIESLLLLTGVFKQAESEVQPGRDQFSDTELLTRNTVAVACADIYQVAERMAQFAERDVVWVSDRPTFGKQLVVAPLDVSELVQEKIFADTAVVLTSATLKVGGQFEPLAKRLGFVTATRSDDSEAGRVFGAQSDTCSWQGLDVGSPFDYPHQGICYFAQHLPSPGRDGIGDEVLSEIAELLWAAGGRTLGLFASQRNAESAAEYCRHKLPDFPLLCQGEAQLSELTRQFMVKPKTSLFGTLSLWQGLDMPGETCRLVIIDKIPFPRPDDPLMQARQQAVNAAGGNGFMQVYATQAGLLLAQGMGRLIRTPNDRGVVAFLDPRIVTARYGSFLRASLPPFWVTNELENTIAALRRLAEND